MKKYKLILCTLSIVGLMLTSCTSNDDEILSVNSTSEITYLPLITLETRCSHASGRKNLIRSLS